MKTYKGSTEIWEAFKEGKKLCLADPDRMHYFSDYIHYNDNDIRHITGKVLYYYANPQMNRVFARLKNAECYDFSLTLWDMCVEEWVDYDEREEFIEANKVVPLTVKQIENKLGYRVKILFDTAEYAYDITTESLTCRKKTL